MARLTAAERAALPDRAFAYVDSKGKRRLPIYDESHVRNALARFDQVTFESDLARDEARRRLLNAAKRYKIVPVGFITNQLATERDHSATRLQQELPTGFVTMLMSDIEGSTGLLAGLGDRYGDLLDDVRRIQREAAKASDGRVVEERADEFFAVFASPRHALDAALSIRRGLARRSDEPVSVRIGIHSGYPTRRRANYVGLPVHTVARLCSAGHGGQILVTGDTRLVLTDLLDDAPATFRSLGVQRLRGIPDEVHVFQVDGDGTPDSFPPLRL